MNLTGRLLAVSKYVSNNAILADIGSDHALLPCFLAEKGIVEKAYAGEVIEGPLNASKKSVNEMRLNDKVFPILSDGLQNIPEDATEMSICGMGAYTILDILNAYPEKVAKYQKIILQPNQHVHLVREYISDHHYTITHEEVLKDMGKYYQIVVFNLEHNENTLSEMEIKYGPLNLKNQSAMFKEYYEYLYNLNVNILKNLDINHPKYQELIKENKEYENILKGNY